MISDMKSVFLSELSRLSLQGFSIGVAFQNKEPTWVHSTYPEAWVDHYVENRFLIDDPTIFHGQRFTGHFTWSELNRLYPANPVFPAAQRFGLNEGNTLSLRMNGLCTILSSAGAAWTYSEMRRAQAAAAGLHALHAPEPVKILLTGKELEGLDLMALGLKDREIADQLGIKLETVRQRRQNSYDKTGARSPASVVSFAIKNGWI